MNEDLDLPGGEEKEMGMQGLKKNNHHLNVKDTTKNANEDQKGCWQTPHLDIIEKIVQRLDLLDRVRSLSILCKYWSSIALGRDICTANQFPWLLGTKQASTCRFNGGSKLSPKYLELELEFSILPGGNVLKLGLSKQNQGWFHSSCKGWLIMVDEENSEVFLLNPISGAKHELPSLTQLPSFETFGAGTTDLFLHKIALSSSNISECTVAAIFSSKEIGVCRPGNKSWSNSPILDDKNESLICLLFSSCGILYALIRNDEKSGSVITRRLHFEDGDELELKLVYDKKEESRKSYSIGHDIPNGWVQVEVKDKSYLIESTNSNEILLIHQFTDRIKSDWNTDLVTRDFLVYKIDPKDCGSFTEIQSLGNQILFVTSRVCSFSFPPSSFKGLEANCIYFVELGVGSCFGSSFAGRSGSNMCDFSHPFYLDGWKFGKSRKCYYHASPKPTWGPSWFFPSL